MIRRAELDEIRARWPEYDPNTGWDKFGAARADIHRLLGELYQLLPPDPGSLLYITPGLDPHARGDYDCNAGWCGGNGTYPRDCPCGGLIHADFDSYDDDGCLILRTRCDTCGKQVHEVE